MTQKYKIGLFIGRFQPLHKGHLLIIRQITKQVEKLIIGIGSSQFSNEPRNPFSSDERQEMIKRAMKEAGIENYKIVEIPDIPDNELWVRHVKKIVGKFDMSWSGDDSVINLFKKAGEPVTVIKKFPGLSGTRVRRFICRGLPWRRFVPQSVNKYLDEIKGVKRIRVLCSDLSTSRVF
ncbi:MAG: nicotinamide-nucleotide adenylyltransferase [Candidatus Magasanikbacteria bacterium]|nr:nicotinamide-nucleotide adenylyltransferase [Candidatus Magasanikbacteria bacterium]